MRDVPLVVRDAQLQKKGSPSREFFTCSTMPVRSAPSPTVVVAAFRHLQRARLLPMRSVEYSQTDAIWLVAGEERVVDMEGSLQLFKDELQTLAASDLQDGLAARSGTVEPTPTSAYVVSVPRGYEEEYGPYEPVHFEWDGVNLTAVMLHIGPSDGADEVVFVDRVRHLLEPLLEDRDWTDLDVEFACEEAGALNAAVTIRFAMAVDGRSVADIFADGTDALRLCVAFSAKAITRESVGDLVRGGAAHLLIGQEEGNWFDAKLLLYDDTFTGQLSLAQDVARFCNAEDGGLILIGAKTKHIPGGEVVKGVRGVEPPLGIVARYSGILDRHLYPLPAGLRIDVVLLPSGKSVVAIDVPPQQEAQKPFLVHGAIRVDGEVEGAFISIVQRRGEASVPITAPMIHATLAAGRARLRGEEDRS
jgi:hypothetical protein